MGSITEVIIGNTKSITADTDMLGNGKKVHKITRARDGKELSFLTGHDYSEVQVLAEFEKQRHFTGYSTEGTVEASIAIPGATLTIAPTTDLSNGDVLTITVTSVFPNTFKGAATGTISYTIPGDAMKPKPVPPNSFKGTFQDSGGNEDPKGTAAQKEAEYMKITTTVKEREFYTQAGLTEIALPQVETIGLQGFNDAKATKVWLPEATSIGRRAFPHSPINELYAPKATSIGIQAFYAMRSGTATINAALRGQESNWFRYTSGITFKWV